MTGQSSKAELGWITGRSAQGEAACGDQASEVRALDAEGELPVVSPPDRVVT